MRLPKGLTEVRAACDKAGMETSEELCARLAETHDTVLLSFSRGKDSIAAWLQCRKFFRRIVPYHLYLVPGLGFVDESLRYFEEVFGQKILNLPHPSLYRWLRNFVFQAPERLAAIEAARLPVFDLADINALIREEMGLGKDVPTAVGVRMCDSLVRRAAIRMYGAENRGGTQKAFYPIFDWNKARTMEAIMNAGIRLPRDYEMFGRSFDGIDRRFLRPLRDKCPEDFERVLEWFPLAEMELMDVRDPKSKQEVA